MSGTGGDLVFWLDLVGTNVKGIEGEPPTGPKLNTDTGENPFWTFNLPEITVMSPDVPDGCEVQSTLSFTLGESKAIWAFSE